MTDTIQMGAGRELDAMVAERVMGWTFHPERDEPFQWEHHISGVMLPYSVHGPYPYSTDIASAWEVHRAMCDRLFSTRQRYYRALQEAVAQRMGSFVMAWPDVISFLEPVDFCRAALDACAALTPDQEPSR